jgi:hypothetical protein
MEWSLVVQSQANVLIRTLTDLGGSPWYPLTCFCSVVMRWRFHTSTLQLFASWSIFLPGPIYLSDAAPLRMRRNNFRRSTSHPFTCITASARTLRHLVSPVPLSPSSRFSRRHPPPQIHCYLRTRHFRLPPSQSGLRTTFRCPRARTLGNTVGCLHSGKALS